MSASLTLWTILFLTIVVLPFLGWYAYRYLNWRGLVRYREPEGNVYFDMLEGNPYTQSYAPSPEYLERFEGEACS